MDVVPLDATLVKGSHGRIPEDRDDWPVLIGDFKNLPETGMLAAVDVHEKLLEHCSEGYGYQGATLL